MKSLNSFLLANYILIYFYQARDSNYTPSWMRQGRSSPAAPGFVPLTPAKSCPSIQPGTEEVPQWKKDLVQRRQSKKHVSLFKPFTPDFLKYVLIGPV